MIFFFFNLKIGTNYIVLNFSLFVCSSVPISLFLISKTIYDDKTRKKDGPQEILTLNGGEERNSTQAFLNWIKQYNTLRSWHKSSQP